VTSNNDATAQTKNNDRAGDEGVCSAQQPKPNRRRDEDRRFVRWINSDFGETVEYQAHRDDVTPLAGWL
jgi:hypothetical protein